MKEIIITDLTRFKGRVNVCTAGIDLSTGQCIRPMPYLQEADRARLKIHPGAIIRGDLTPKRSLNAPHIEDHNYTKLDYLGPCSEEQFRRALELSLRNGISAGFNTHLPVGSKHIPTASANAPDTSIITIKVEARNFEIIEDQYNSGKIKANFTDRTGSNYRYISITDLDFHDYAAEHHSRNDLDSLNRFIRRQQELFLRIGLSREYQVGERKGYWLQVNGIYTFPDFLQHIRGLQP